jgi:hypothetical protein
MARTTAKSEYDYYYFFEKKGNTVLCASSAGRIEISKMPQASGK